MRTTDLLAHLDSSDDEDDDSFVMDESSTEVSTDSELSDFDKNFYDEDIDELENIEKQPLAPLESSTLGLEERGYSGHALFRWGNTGSGSVFILAQIRIWRFWII